jgi:hypothetical protein
MQCTLLNDIKLHFHCGFKMHRRFEFGRDYHLRIFGKDFYFLKWYRPERIACGDCGYGQDLETACAQSRMYSAFNTAKEELKNVQRQRSKSK